MLLADSPQNLRHLNSGQEKEGFATKDHRANIDSLRKEEMNKIAIVLSSETGQTEKIANAMAYQMRRWGSEVEVFNIAKVDAPWGNLLRTYDAVIVGAPVYLQDFPKPLVDWAWNNRVELMSVPSALYTVSLEAADLSARGKSKEDKAIQSFLKATDMRPRYIASLAGCLAYTKYNFMKRLIMKKTASLAGCPTDVKKDHELTNWDDAFKFVRAFQAQDMNSEFACLNRFSGQQAGSWSGGVQRVA